MPEKSLAASPVAKAKSRPQWDKAEKRFIVACLLLIGVFCSSLLWWGRLNELPDYQIPVPSLPSPNAFDTFLQATFLMAPVQKPAVDPILDVDEPTDPKESAARYSLARREAWLGQNAGALALLRQGLQQQYQQPAARSWSASFPYLARYRELARRLIVESKTHQLRGRNGAAASSALDALQFGHQVPRGGSSFAALVGTAIQNMGRAQLKKVISQLSAAECKSVARRLQKIRARVWPFAEIVREEKWGTQASLLEIMKKPDWAKEFSGMTGTATDFMQKWRIRFVGKRRVMDNYMDFMDKSIIEAAKPYARSQDVPVPNDPVNQMLALNFSQMRFSYAKSDAGSALLLVALALRTHRLERGSYPDKLSQLVPTYLPKIPADAFGSGEALRYQKQGNTYKLWSIGPDRKDNNGTPIQQSAPYGHFSRYYEENESSTPRDQTAQGDWVFQP